jgi:hypothetical protein
MRVIMEVFNQTIQSIPYNEISLTSPRKIRVLLAITGIATGGATNVVLDIAGHLKNHPDFDI